MAWRNQSVFALLAPLSTLSHFCLFDIQGRHQWMRGSPGKHHCRLTRSEQGRMEVER